mmetsp:Transcript_7346/g.13215  ORF Transcript_7346/g.13215 Transcript_7346/m.13215 type:complete len:117 (+) Transcript_7346:243-593(+)
MATLMGAQLLVATGKKHAGVLTHSRGIGSEISRRCWLASQSGDLVHPFSSSRTDPMPRRLICAGHFIDSRLEEDYAGGWLHVETYIYGGTCAVNNELDTGYGVGLLVLSLLGVKEF